MHRLFQQAKNWKTFLKSFKDGLIFLYLTTFIYDICIINTGGLLFFNPFLYFRGSLALANSALMCSWYSREVCNQEQVIV